MQQIQIEAETIDIELVPDVGAMRAIDSQEMEELEETTPPTETLETLLLETQQQQKRYRRTLYGVIGTCFVGSMGLVGATAQVNPLAALWLFNGLALCGGVFAFRNMLRWTSKAAKLAKANDVRVVGMLVELLTAPRPRDQAIAREALIEWLPRLQPQDATLLDANQRALLRRFVAGIPLNLNARTVPFAIAILKAYEQVGDSNDLARVEKLARGTGGWSSDPRIQEAAQACLPHLKQRLREANDPHMLLRASQDTGVPAQTLLRAAHGGAESDPQELLRADGGEAP